MKRQAFRDPDILNQVKDVLQMHKGKTLAVYKEAERLRRQFAERNIALEDIVDLFVTYCSAYGAGISFDPSEAADALLGTGRAAPPDMHGDPSR